MKSSGSKLSIFLTQIKSGSIGCLERQHSSMDRTAHTRRAIQIWEDEHAESLKRSRLAKKESFGSDSLTDVDVVKSIEKAELDLGENEPIFKDDKQRHVSSTTAIRVDDDNPFTAEEMEGGYDAFPNIKVRYLMEDEPFSEDGDRHSAWEPESRKMSGAHSAVSTMPEDTEIHHSPYLKRSPLSPRENGGTPQPNNMRQSRLLSSPAHPSQDTRRFSPGTPKSSRDRFASSPLARNPNSGFRNPSSIRAMQMSSPSPPPSATPRFAQSPRSARQRQLEADALPRSRSGTPSQISNPNKEYPLILLHCSFVSIIPDFPSGVLNAALPPWIQHNLSMLKEKVNATVVERGVLIPHPGDDFELLEERILESLELKRPRVGKCGHFVSSNVDSQGSRQPSIIFDEHERDGFEHAPPTCEVCACGVEDDHRGCAGDKPSQRFELNIYAANGLMRSGAWNAAWREMEKVDIEVGIWIPEDVRQQLEEEAVHYEERWEKEGLQRVRELRNEMPFAPTPPQAASFGGPSMRQRRRNVTGGSEHELPNNASRAMPKERGAGPSRPRSQHMRSRSGYESYNARSNQQEPLSTLLARVIRQKLEPTKELFLQVLVMVLVMVVVRQWWSPALPPLASSILDTVPVMSEAVSAAAPSEPIASAHATITSMAGASPTNAIPACTFAPDQAEAAGMTALPASVVRQILDAASTSVAALEATPSPDEIAPDIADGKPMSEQDPDGGSVNDELAPEGIDQEAKELLNEMFEVSDA